MVYDKVPLRAQIAYGEAALGKMARKMGGKWACNIRCQDIILDAFTE